MKEDHADQGKRKRKSKHPHEEVASEILKVILPWIEALIGTSVKEGRGPGVQDNLTFEEVVTYFTQAHNGDPAIAVGALHRRPHPQGYLVFQIFLDESHELIFKELGYPLGRVLVARRFDDELDEKFADVDLVLFR